MTKHSQRRPRRTLPEIERGLSRMDAENRAWSRVSRLLTKDRKSQGRRQPSR